MVRMCGAYLAGQYQLAHVPISDGQVQETGDFEGDGVTFKAFLISAGIPTVFVNAYEIGYTQDCLCCTAAAIPGTLVNLAAGGGARESVCFGHPSGTLRVGAQARHAF